MVKIPFLALFWPILGKIYKIFKNPTITFFCPLPRSIWSKFELSSTFLAKLDSFFVILRYCPFKSWDSFFPLKFYNFASIFSKIIKIYQILWFYMMWHQELHELTPKDCIIMQFRWNYCLIYPKNYAKMAIFYRDILITHFQFSVRFSNFDEA